MRETQSVTYPWKGKLGKRKMPAAMMGYPHTTNRTKVTAEQIPDLLAYIHSLKNSK